MSSHYRVLGWRLIAGLLTISILLSAAGCTNAPTATAVPTDTAVPATSTSTATSIPPTNTSVPPTSTSTSTATATQPPTATSLPTGFLLSTDLTSKEATDKDGWGASDDSVTKYEWTSSGLVVSPSQTDRVARNTSAKYYTDFGVEIEAQAAGEGYIEYGLIFRENQAGAAADFYAFGVNTNGQYFLWKQLKGKFTPNDPVSLTNSPYVKKGSTANKLSVVAQGSTLLLYVNGSLVGKITDSSLSNGRVGVFVSTGKDTTNHVTFNHFSLHTADHAKSVWGTTLVAGAVTTNNSVATPKPAATKAPTAAPTSAVSKPAGTTLTVLNTFPVSCLIVLWGPADVRVDASAENIAFSRINPGVYGWRAFLGGAETGEAGNLEIKDGDACVFVCDKQTLAIRYGCH